VVDAVRHGAAVALIAASIPLGDRSPAYHSCDSAGSADAAVATSTTIRATNESIS
jgi:hypothetical protein